MKTWSAEDDGRGCSPQEHLPTDLGQDTARTRVRALFTQLDAVLGDEPVLTVDPADAIREDRDRRDARDAHRAEDYA